MKPRIDWEKVWNKIDAHCVECLRGDCWWDHQKVIVRREVERQLREKG